MEAGHHNKNTNALISALVFISQDKAYLVVYPPFAKMV